MPLLPLLLLAAGTPAVYAQDAAPLTLSVQDAIDRALQRNFDLRVALAEVDSAEGALATARGIFDPGLTASFDHSNSVSQAFIQELNLFADVTSTSDNYNLGLSSFLPTGSVLGLNFFGQDQLSVANVDLFGQDAQETRNIFTSLTASLRQPLLQGFRTTYNLNGVRSAARQLTRAEAAVLEKRQQVLADTANAYWNLYYQQRLAGISQETLAVTQEERRIVIARIEQGQLAPVERSRVEAAVLEAESSLLSAQIAAEAAAETLLLLLGEPLDRTITITSSPDPILPGDPSAAAAEADALERNASLIQLREAESIAEQNLDSAKHALLPELTGTASYSVFGREAEGFSDALREMSSGDLRSWAVGAELSVPLGNRVDRGSYQQRLADLQSATLSREAAERALAQQVRAQVRAVRSARLQVQLAQANLVAAQATLEADQALRDAGQAIEKDVLESIRDVDTARINAEKAQADYNLALVELNRLRGVL